MFSIEAREQIHDILELFASVTHIPIELYEVGDHGKVVLPSIRSHDDLFPLHCRSIWSVNGGQGLKECNVNRCWAVQQTLKSSVAEKRICHAGLDLIVEVIYIDNKPRAVLQYGAFILNDEEQTSTEERLSHHNSAMQKLGVTEEEAIHIQRLLLHETPRRTPVEWKVLQESFFHFLSDYISRIVVSWDAELRNRMLAYHDVQTRLTAALAYAEICLEDLPVDTPESLKVQLQDIAAAISNAGTAMHGLTRGEYLPRVYRYRSYDLYKIIDRACNVCRMEAEKKGVQIRLDLQPASGHVLLEVSYRHIEQAFNNLIHNAVKYSYSSHYQTPTPRYILIRGRVVNDGYEVVISNYGVGIESDEYDRIFQSGYRGRLAALEDRTGSGQGLWLTKRIIDQHKGKISVESEPVTQSMLNGSRPFVTRFSIWLPFKQ